jgi:hypothetical protein
MEAKYKCTEFCKGCKSWTYGTEHCYYFGTSTSIGGVLTKFNPTYNEDCYYYGKISECAAKWYAEIDKVKDIERILNDAGIVVKAYQIGRKNKREVSFLEARQSWEADTVFALKVSYGRIGKFIDIVGKTPEQILNDAIMALPKTEFTDTAIFFKKFIEKKE